MVNDRSFWLTSRAGLCRLCLALLVFPLGAEAAGPATAVCLWNRLFLDGVRRESTAPGLASRNLAVFHATLHDGLEGLYGGTDFILARHEPAGPVDAEAFVHIASARMLAIFYPSARTVNAAESARLTAHLADAERAAAAAYAEAVVRASLQTREGDGSANTLTYVPKDQIGLWRRTPPDFRPPELSHWSALRPFVLPSADAFRPPPPPALDSPEYAEAIEQVREWGGLHSSSRTPEQTRQAQYWAYFSYTATPAGLWNEILCRIFADHAESDLRRAARGYALLNIALADAGVAGWDCKYHYELWRPVHAIRMADLDGNPGTIQEDGWEPLLRTPPHPEYVSGHSTFSGAGATILARFFGTDAFSFVSTNPQFPGEERHYDSFSACAAECGMSRIYGGIHYAFSNREGLALGARVADYVFQHVFEK